MSIVTIRRMLAKISIYRIYAGMLTPQ